MNKIKDNLSIILMTIFGAIIGIVNYKMGMNLLEIIGAVTVSFLISWGVEVKIKETDKTKNVLSKKLEGSESNQSGEI